MQGLQELRHGHGEGEPSALREVLRVQFAPLRGADPAGLPGPDRKAQDAGVGVGLCRYLFVFAVITEIFPFAVLLYEGLFLSFRMVVFLPRQSE